MSNYIICFLPISEKTFNTKSKQIIECIVHGITYISSTQYIIILIFLDNNGWVKKLKTTLIV